jgi:hypothetical protein
LVLVERNQVLTRTHGWQRSWVFGLIRATGHNQNEKMDKWFLDEWMNRKTLLALFHRSTNPSIHPSNPSHEQDN